MLKRILAMLLFGAAPAFAEKPVVEKPVVENPVAEKALTETPSAEEFLRLLFRSGDVALNDSNLGCSHNTIAEYLAFLIATAANKAPGQVLENEAGCEPTSHAGTRECRYYVRLFDPETKDSWRYGIEVQLVEGQIVEGQLEEGQQKIKATHVRCPGMP